MTIERPMFPPAADSVDAFPLQPATGQPGSQTLTAAFPKPAEALDLAQLRFVRCLVERYGVTVDQAGAVMAAELARVRSIADKKRRRRMALIGAHLVSVSV